ncbi:MAG: ATPase, T2SS/T4P/T4SS family [Patescibacteria group bacterium]
MSQKIVANLFNYAIAAGAEHLVIGNKHDRISLDCHFPDDTTRALALPKKLEQEFFTNLQRILAIAPGDLLSHEYRKAGNKEGRWHYYLTVVPDGQGEKIIISLINQDNRRWRLSQLGLQKNDQKTLDKITRWRSGLIIVSSPPQSGKSATLYSLLDLWDRQTMNIYALDDNLPADLPGVNVLAPRAANWEKILHHDSDIILADDLDDEEALKNALRAAASGRLVLGTMTAISSLAVLARIQSLKLPRRLKFDSLRLIINQRLAKLKSSRAKTAWLGRKQIGLFELLELTPEIRSLLMALDEADLKSDGAIQKLEKLLSVSGFRPVAHDEKQKVKDGLI